MRLVFLAFFIIFFFSFVQSVSAKVLPQARGAKASVPRPGGNSGGGILVSAHLRGDRQAVVINFANLQNATNVTYALTYTHDGQQEGASGSITQSGESTATRELLFGTCSKDVCRYHSNVVNAKLEITTRLTNGKKSIKRFRIRV